MDKMWWDETVTKWTSALNLSAEVCKSVSSPASETIGSWFEEAGSWHATLDPEHCLRCSGGDIDTTVREALSFTLRLAAQAAGVQPQLNLATWLERITQKKDEELLSYFTDQPSQSKLSPHFDEPGYFVWIIYHAKSPVSQLASVRSPVDEVVEAYLHQKPKVHASIGSHSDSMLTFVSASAVADFELTMQEDESVNGLHVLAVLRTIGNDLVEVLAQDAFVDATIIFGRYVQCAADVYRGIVSLEYARRIQRRVSGLKVSVYGESPIEHLLLSVPYELRSVFLDTIKLRLPATDWNVLPDELAATLQGLVEANLNVSEAARTLYLHRNTMNYRLERIRLATGYDVRQFLDAAALWFALRLQTDNPSD